MVTTNMRRVVVVLGLCLLPAAARAQETVVCDEGQVRSERQLTPSITDKGGAWGATLRVFCADREGSTAGTVYLLDPSGRVLGTGREEDGRAEGRWLYYWANGVKKAEEDYHRDLYAGAVRHWYESGQLEKEEPVNADGSPHGQWRRWWPNGQLMQEEQWFHGRRIGSRSWYADGKRECVNPGTDADGKRDGTQVCWYPNGTQRLESHWSHGKKSGRDVFWNEDGVVITTGMYVDDRKCGAWLIMGKRELFDCGQSADGGSGDAG